MIQDRLITIIEEEKLTTKKLEELTGIDRYKWGHVKSKSQRLNAEHNEDIYKCIEARRKSKAAFMMEHGIDPNNISDRFFK